MASARVTASSPSQSATATTDASGRFSFVSLAPDTYILMVAPTSIYDAATVSGVTVLADQTQSVTVQQSAKLKTIGAVTSRAASALVKPGTTADVYSISALQQDKASALGGGGNLNSAWSAISSVPGVFVLPGQNGYIGAAPTLSIRGGDYDQIGYELDGIPVNRAFDNYPSNSLSSLGQQELQVYTGAAPANAEASGLSGYINQVIKSGTAPAYRSLDFGIGSTTLYNKLAFETGGASPSRTFSYYAGFGGYNQDTRVFDQFNGASLSRDFGPPLAACDPSFSPTLAPSCFDPRTGASYLNGGQTPAYVLGPANYGTGIPSRIDQRDSIVNVHLGIPRKSGDRDDVQLLWDNTHISNVGFNSINDAGGAAYLQAIGASTTYADGYQTTIPYGTLLGPGYTGGGVKPYLFPESPGGRAMFAQIAPNLRDEFVNDQGILKLQYQRNFGTSAFLRVYGYTYYSDWLNNGPNSFNENYLAFDTADYQVANHTRGLSAMYSAQINPQNLLTLQGSYTTAHSYRFNDSGIGIGNTTVGYLVDSTNPASGYCYMQAPGGTGAATAVKGCNFGAGGTGAFTHFTLQQALTNSVQPASGTCGGGACEYLVVAGGPSGSFNTVVPKFAAFSLTDNWKPTDKLNVNVGVRYDSFVFGGADTTNSIARALYFSAYNLTHALPLNNASAQVESYRVLQPRAGLTYTIDPRTVIRASYGRYAEPPNAAFEQYNYLQPNSTGLLANFTRFGLPNTPGHDVRPEISNNYDLSFEHQ
ncbi:MAG TPA: TonB-dependent receptor, partial [Candidatus Elarobacter sp.]